jgi:hypothetical protein
MGPPARRDLRVRRGLSRCRRSSTRRRPRRPALPGTVVTATADCPAGEVLLGGGAAATTNQAPEAARFALQSSAPLDADSWRATAIVQLVLVPGQTVSVHATAICTT